MSQKENPETNEQIRETTMQDMKTNLGCFVHHKVDKYETADIHENVCRKGEKLLDFKGTPYCIFHLPTDDKKDFEKFFKERISDIEREIDSIKKMPEKEREDSKRKISYDFRYVWFPSDFSLFESKKEFTIPVDFSGATFSAKIAFEKATFTESLSFASATFLGDVYFGSATFLNFLDFRSATFSGYANFKSAAFSGLANFNSAVFSKVTNFNSAKFNEEAYFQGATFSGITYFIKTKFLKSNSMEFYYATFERDTFFDEAEFKNGVSFNSVVFCDESDVFFRQTHFAGNVDFHYATALNYLRFSNLRQSNENTFNFQEAAFEKASRISFHTARLYPNWFVNVDPRKFIFTDIDWKNIKSSFSNSNIKAELESLEKRGISKQGKRLLEKACRQLALNAEENNRYEEASNFRYMAMEIKRLESKGWLRQTFNLYWIYKWTSGYGERWIRSILVLVGLLLFFGLIYAFPLSTFDYGEHKREISQEPVEQRVYDKAAEGERFHDMNWNEGIVHSLYVASLQRPEPKAADTLTKTFIILETIFAPLQVALLALAIRRKFMR